MPSILPGEVRIEVRSVGLSAIDISIWRGEYDVQLPLILGHEISGFIHESSVPGIEPGTYVTTEVDTFCGTCWYCRHNLRHHCKSRTTLGVTRDGGLAEYLTVLADMVHILPDQVDSVTGVFVHPVATALETVNRVPPEHDEPVAVIGTGKIGLIISQVYEAFGAEPFVVGRNQWKLGLARQIGIRHVINNRDSGWKNAILDATEGVGARVVVEATGTVEGLRDALEVVRNGGTVVLKSIHSQAIPVQAQELVSREITLIGTRAGPFDEAIDLLAKGRVEVKRLVSAQFPLDEGERAFEYATKPDVTKVIINV